MMYFPYRNKSVGDIIPKSIRKRLDAKREKEGLPPFDSFSEKDSKKRDKPTCDVSDERG